MAQVEYALDEHVAVVTLNDGENRFNPDFLNAFIALMDDIENKTDVQTLMVKSAHEKIFCNGIDLEWLAPVIQKGDMAAAKSFFYLMNTFFKRTLMSPLLTVACINGHSFAGGAIWSCAFDFRFMRSDRGYFCFPEVDLGIPFLPGMLELLKKAIPFYKLEEMHHTGIRLTAEECQHHHIISKACHIDTLEQETLAFAKSLKKKKVIIAEMKSRLYRDNVHAFDIKDKPYIESEKFNIG
jgi:enoyl-CoA hydratase/carnithine racemase